MKIFKILGICFSALSAIVLFATNVYASRDNTVAAPDFQKASQYEITVINNTSNEITLDYNGNTSNALTVAPGSEANTNLNEDTTYMFRYQGQWSKRGLGTIQRASHQWVYQITPTDENMQARIDYLSTTTSSNVYEGYVMNTPPVRVDGKGCKADVGNSATCVLADNRQEVPKKLIVDVTQTNLNNSMNK